MGIRLMFLATFVALVLGLTLSSARADKPIDATVVLYDQTGAELPRSGSDYILRLGTDDPNIIAQAVGEFKDGQWIEFIAPDGSRGQVHGPTLTMTVTSGGTYRFHVLSKNGKSAGKDTLLLVE